jgi:2-polyprenyl-3-methyl-5-hydroxy-6-metoxy-1,4-benzoquinol methylase
VTDRLPFVDDHEHFVNGVLRLLAIDEREFDLWRQLGAQHEGEIVDRLAAGWRELRPQPPCTADASAPVSHGPRKCEGRLWHQAIGATPTVGFARSRDGQLAWLVRYDGGRWIRVTEPPVYEEAYFEGDRSSGGYDAYREEAGWRLEKASRQVRELRAATGIATGRVLDIGSGYGYFRVALGGAGYEHEGVEISEHGRLVAHELYGQNTHPGVLHDFWQSWPGRFDAVTAFDLIEHLADPTDFLVKVRHVLRRGGCLGLKTPNVNAPEADVFGPHYHSLKREHLVLFTPKSLTAVATDAGLELVETVTISHLLRGFVGRGTCVEWERQGRGADIVAWYRRPG